LIVHIKSTTFLPEIARELPEIAFKLAEAFWPGPLTLILKRQEHIPDLITAGQETVAVRVPNHPVISALLSQLDFPLAAPSANPFGSISPTSAAHVFNYFGEELKVILEGGICERGVESTIIGFEDEQPVLYRHGSIAVEEIEQVVGKVRINIHNDSKPSSPGMLSRHYAPRTQTYLTTDVLGLLESFREKKVGLLLFKNKLLTENTTLQVVLSEAGDLQEAAKELYAALHYLDKGNLDVIIAERFPDKGLGKTLNDRLERATKAK
jgi:L-threonylcarbamoyladenylate synthase